MKDDTTFQEVREKSVLSWLDDMTQYEDIVVRGGVKVTKEYVEDLKKQIAVLEEKNELKDKYLKQLKSVK